MSLASEDDVKKALGISSFRELSKDKMLAFAAAMPDMANEVRVKLIEQLPSFQKFALEAVSFVERAHSVTIDANEKSRADAHEAFAEVRRLIKGELDREGISDEQRRFLIETAVETADKEAAKDTENKRFLDSALKAVGVAAGVAALAAVVFVGGKVIIGNDEA